ncbi:MAG: cytochrome-c oxidase, cbb3-type subunit III [Emcibacteraceae bacterium]|nr:cytochrome-c oxidase, cbb3-type subunit III [Emcibacteraceae bacterium]MDG1858741.1 cytochrome-c oxidase, cbb3-type subunit III [Emcibacteraceae bacterium]
MPNKNNVENKEIDEVSGVDTTGHEWDGIKELNNPMPRWWIYSFIVCCIWGFAYQFLYPSWPLINDYYEGYLDETNRDIVHEELAEVAAIRNQFSQRMEGMELNAIKSDNTLYTYAMEGGRAAFGDNCAPCHGTGAAGFVGYPNLNDDDWIWGGTLEDIQYSINYGIRGVHDDTRFNEMPAYLRDELLSREEIQEVATYVESLSNVTVQSSPAGKELFIDNCAMCHGDDGTGLRELGGPNLTDAITLYVTDRDSIVDIISYSRGGVMPTWNGRLDDATVKSLAIYVHSLGGGE